MNRPDEKWNILLRMVREEVVRDPVGDFHLASSAKWLPLNDRSAASLMFQFFNRKCDAQVLCLTITAVEVAENASEDQLKSLVHHKLEALRGTAQNDMASPLNRWLRKDGGENLSAAIEAGEVKIDARNDRAPAERAALLSGTHRPWENTAAQ